MRAPVFAGQFYEKTKKKLTAQIKRCFTSKLGPKKTPNKKKSKKRIIAAIVPHSALPFSGQCAAHVYKKIAESTQPDTIIIVGPNHGGAGPSVVMSNEKTWKTPLGQVDVDTELVSRITELSNYAKANESAHQGEYAIEVQLPFLQYIFKNKFKIVPVIMRGLKVIEESNDLINSILNASYELNRNVLLLVTSDFTHYGPQFLFNSYKGTKAQVKNKVKTLDKKAISYIEKLNEVSFLKHIIKNESTICGYAPITSAIIYSRSMKSKKGKLMKYYSSGDINKDYKNFVTYASILFEQK